MRCPACQADNRAGVRFCEECGASLDVTCPACGASLPVGRRFCGQCGAPLPGAAPARPGAVPAGTPGPDVRSAAPQAYTPRHLAERILRERGALVGERKQVTVLFADVFGFTAISERLDPEEVHALINRAFELMLAEVHRYEGTVNQFLGDGLMALFGAPVAHEDHARRAAHAALGIARALADYRETLQRERGIDFRLRMGLNTGLVVVGAIGDNLRMDYTAVGDTTNIAARMQQLAEPGQIVVAEATERLIAPFFELGPLGTFAVRNREQPVAAWELRRPRPAASRLAARVARGRSPFVGRDDALATLERAFAAARGGRGQVVFVVGEPGMGKSRLLLEFRERVGDRGTWIQGDCLSFGGAVPFLPVIEALRQLFGIAPHAGQAEVVARVDQGAAVMGGEAPEAVPYLKFLLGVAPDPAVAAMDPAQRRTRIVDAVTRLVAARSRERPTVLVVEDAHWIDPASEDLLRALAESLAGMAVLLVVTYRPVYRQPFGDRTYYWRIPLQPVDEPGAVRIVRAALGVDDLPAELAATIARKAEGNPFFLEEIGRALVETGAVRVERGRLVAAGSTATIAVPDTVQDVIAARIDRLGEREKRTLQTAAVIGREFPLGLLRRVGETPGDLEASLDDLKRAELIDEKVGPGERQYAFRHALTQDVAYTSLLQSERRRLHAAVGAALEAHPAGRPEERAEALVHHFTRGEVWDRAARYAREAAERAAALCVDDKAIEYYETALQALGRLPETPETARAGIDVRLAMRAPLWRGGHPDRLFALFTEAEALAARHGETERVDTIYAFLVQYHWARGEQDRALEYGQRCLERAAVRGDLGLRITGLFYLCHAYAVLGRFADAVRTGREIVALLEGDRARERFGLSGLPYSGACALVAACLAEQGDFEGALAALEQGQRVADAAGHLYSQMVLAAARGDVLVSAGRWPEALGVLEAALPVCRDKRFVGQLINTLKHLGRALIQAGRPAEAVPVIQEAIDLQDKANVYVQRSLKHAALAQAWLAQGAPDLAESHLRRALEFADRQGERPWEGWACLTYAELETRRGEPAAAARYLGRARAIAAELGMRPLLEQCRALGERA
ncbi:MAG TPA: AAA family ATPase [Calidithermus sp.]|nr:AAA family ATPase [Calidithermus sp.]